MTQMIGEAPAPDSRRSRGALSVGGSAITRLAIMSGKDMLRNPLTGLSMWFMVGILVTIYVSMWLAFMVLGSAPSATVDADHPSIAPALERAGVRVIAANSTEDSTANSTINSTAGTAESAAESEPKSNARVTVSGGQAVIELQSGVAWERIWQGLRDAGVSADAIVATDDSGETVIDPLREYLGVIPLLGAASAALIGLTVPIVAMRERGLLRLLGTTPLRRSTFLLAQLPVRFAIAAAIMAVTVGIAVWRRYIDAVEVGSLSVSMLLGISLLFSMALLLAAKSRNAESIQQTAVMINLALVFVSGGLVPGEIVPGPLQAVLNCLPTTWFAVAASAGLTGSEPFLPIPVLWVLMAVVAAGSLWLATRLFDWDQQEPRPGGQGTKMFQKTSK